MKDCNRSFETKDKIAGAQIVRNPNNVLAGLHTRDTIQEKLQTVFFSGLDVLEISDTFICRNLWQ